MASNKEFICEIIVLWKWEISVALKTIQFEISFLIRLEMNT